MLQMLSNVHIKYWFSYTHVCLYGNVYFGFTMHTCAVYFSFHNYSSYLLYCNFNS